METSAPKKVKILITGSVNGCFKKLFSVVDNIQSKKGKFDLLLCTGNFFAGSGDVKEMESSLEEFYNVVLKEPNSINIPTYFVDSTDMIGPFMHKKGMHKFCPNLTFLGRSGVHTFPEHHGLRIAFVSGKDAEVYGQQVTESIKVNKEYYGKYFSYQDIEEAILANRNQNVDILITSQLPLALFQSEDMENQSSSSLDVLVDNLSPRYIYSACEMEAHVKVQPFLNRKEFLSRPIQLANMPGSSLKPKESKATYI